MPKVLHDGIGPGHADDPVTGPFISIAHRRQCRAFAGPGFAGNDGKTVLVDCPPERRADDRR